MKVEIVPYNPDWKQKYLFEAELIKKACGSKILTIEHAGSTSVEGLAAKPIIDIYVGTKTLRDANDMINGMTGLGYEYIKKYEDELPFRRYFRKDVEGRRAFHVHATPASHPFRRDDLKFRDYLSINKKAKKEYEALKIELAKKQWTEKESYAKAKTGFCLKIKKVALEYFTKQYEETESEATYLMHAYADDAAGSKAKFKMLREGSLTAIRTDIFPGFSLNRALGVTNVNNDLLDKMDEFYKGKEGKFALQIPPNELDEEKVRLLNSRGFTYSNSWVTFYKDSSPVESRSTDLEIKEIGKEHANEFARILNDVFAFPHEFDGIAGSVVGQKEWVTYMALDGSKAVGSASVCIIRETAYLSFANVIPEYRRRGVQGELGRKLIDTARELRAKWIVVDTAETSEEHPNPSYWNVLRHGFRLMYHRPNYVKIQ
ncbi:MAG: bifunctional GrpB family protein/GNAT family N-acetyltransferase [Chlorobi bacterium]|nr:bifunctional GrpB family protein/GNAT family N-acetyltransferase [Chlorobiota bacterium]MCI0715879.1 bifunctional GrpB family protein/GNAT family N-acetyltransferase [Chlorobiota bacterium]